MLLDIGRNAELLTGLTGRGVRYFALRKVRPSTKVFPRRTSITVGGKSSLEREAGLAGWLAGRGAGQERSAESRSSRCETPPVDEGVPSPYGHHRRGKIFSRKRSGTARPPPLPPPRLPPRPP